MRIIHVVPAISEEATGPSYSVVRLCETLNNFGHEATIASLLWSEMTPQLKYLKTFPLGFGPRRLGRAPAMLKWLKAETKMGSIHIVHNHSLWMMPNVYPGWVAKTRNLPYFVSPRGTLSKWAMSSGSKVKRIFWPLVQRPSLEAVTCWHATAETEYQDIRHLNFHQPVAIIPNGIDVPELPPKKVSEFRTLLFLSRIHRKKGLDMLLPAWSEVQDKHPNWCLTIAGPDKTGYLVKMQNLSNDLRLKRVKFLGPVYGREKWMVYRNADLFVLPTYSENFGISVAEALAAGTPAIVSKGAPWNGLQEHKAGWWIEIGIESLKTTLDRALSQPPEVLCHMGERGRKWMKDEFSWSGIGEMMSVTYHWIINGGKPPSWIRVD